MIKPSSMVQRSSFSQISEDLNLLRKDRIVCCSNLVEKADSSQAIRVLGGRDVVGILGVPVEQLDLHGLLYPVQVMLGSLCAVLTPVPHRMMKLVSWNVKNSNSVFGHNTHVSVPRAPPVTDGRFAFLEARLRRLLGRFNDCSDTASVSSKSSCTVKSLSRR